MSAKEIVHGARRCALGAGIAILVENPKAA